MSAITLGEDDIDAFNEALSLVFLGSRIDHIECVDDGVHLRNLCRAATRKLCEIRNRHNTIGIELAVSEES